MVLKESPSQTAGPYVHIGLTPNFSGMGQVFPQDLGSRMVDDATRGRRIAIEGMVYDGSGAPLKDVLLEIWQADAEGFYNSPAETRKAADPHFSGWGRAAVDMDTGRYRFETIKPGSVPFPGGGLQAPHISFWVVARGINLGLNTRMYFAEDAELIASDPVLNFIPAERRPTIIVPGRDGLYTFDIQIQGSKETVFFDI